MAVAAGGGRLSFDEPAEVEEVVNGARQLQRPGGGEAVDVPSRLQQAPEVWVAQIRYRDHEAPEGPGAGAGAVVEADGHRQPALLHLLPPLLPHLLPHPALLDFHGRGESPRDMKWGILYRAWGPNQRDIGAVFLLLSVKALRFLRN